MQRKQEPSYFRLLTLLREVISQQILVLWQHELHNRNQLFRRRVGTVLVYDFRPYAIGQEGNGH